MLPPVCRKYSSDAFSAYFSRTLRIRRILCSIIRLRQSLASNGIGFSVVSDNFSRFLAGEGDCACTCGDDTCDDVGATNTLLIEVRTSFGDVVSISLVEFCGRDTVGGDVPTIPTALRGGVPAMLTILVTCCVPLALVVALFDMTCK